MRVIDLRLAARPESVPDARHALDDLAGLASRASLEDARLLVSELVTNSIRHGHLSTAQDIWLQADLEGDTLHVEVRDPGGGFELQPRIAEKDDQDSGWGLTSSGSLPSAGGSTRTDPRWCGSTCRFAVARTTRHLKDPSRLGPLMAG